MIPYPPGKWAAVRTSYFEDGIWRARDLAALHGVTLGSVQRHMSTEKWKNKLEIQIKKDGYQEERREKDDKTDMAGLILKKKKHAIRQLILSTTSLLDKVYQRIKRLNSSDGAEISEMILAIKNLQGMLDGLLGNGVKGGAGVGVGVGQIQVSILAQVVEAADKASGQVGEVKGVEVASAILPASVTTQGKLVPKEDN